MEKGVTSPTNSQRDADQPCKLPSLGSLASTGELQFKSEWHHFIVTSTFFNNQIMSTNTPFLAEGEGCGEIPEAVLECVNLAAQALAGLGGVIQLSLQFPA